MSFNVHRDDAGLWVITSPSGQVFGLFSNEVEAGDAADFFAIVRGLGDLHGVEIPRVENKAITEMRARGERRPAPQGTDRCVECNYLMRKRTEAPTPGWRRRDSRYRCQVCMAREKRAAVVAEDNTPMAVGGPLVDDFARQRAARAERKARAERARKLDNARRIAVKRSAS